MSDGWDVFVMSGGGSWVYCKGQGTLSYRALRFSSSLATLSSQWYLQAAARQGASQDPVFRILKGLMLGYWGGWGLFQFRRLLSKAKAQNLSLV